MKYNGNTWKFFFFEKMGDDVNPRTFKTILLGFSEVHHTSSCWDSNDNIFSTEYERHRDGEKIDMKNLAAYFYFSMTYVHIFAS